MFSTTMRSKSWQVRAFFLGFLFLVCRQAAFAEHGSLKAPFIEVLTLSRVELPEHDSVLAGRLNQALATYKVSPSPVTWQEFWQEFKQIAHEAVSNHYDLLHICQSLAGLSDLGFRMSEAPGLRVFSFTRVPESEEILVEWKEFTHAQSHFKPGRKGRAIKSAPAPLLESTKQQALAFPNGVFITEARLVSQNALEVKDPASLGMPKRTSGSRYLILCGADKKSQLSFLQGYCLGQGRWVKCPELFAAIPPFLLQNVPGKLNFAGVNLIFTSDGLKGLDSQGQEGNSKQEVNTANSYRIVLRFLGDHYAFDSEPANNASMAIAWQFASAIDKGRVDLVRAWLVDARLASIPAYLGLYNRESHLPPFKLIAMATPASGLARFRLITHTKDDLILDVGKIKTGWVIKALFIAPADPLANTLSGKIMPKADAPVLEQIQGQ